jgi:hypothetical protein
MDDDEPTRAANEPTALRAARVNDRPCFAWVGFAIEQAVARIVPQNVANHQARARSIYGRGNSTHRCAILRHRLLEQHRQARLRDGHRCWFVEAIGQTHVHCVECRFAQHLSDLSKRLRLELCAGPLRDRRVNVAYRGKLGTAACSDDPRMQIADVTQTYDTDSNAFGHNIVTPINCSAFHAY